ncbi:MAG TPA: YdcF family protein, partial [Vicinamibacterales bacterium]|nr:YdcF family protein [Vicinamibacterales bacterium]
MFRRTALLLILLAFAAVAAFVPYAGRFLASEDPLERADAIVALAGPRAERWLEAVDLYHENWAPEILLSPGRVEPAEDELRRRGVTFAATVDLIRAAIQQLSVPSDALIVMPGSMDNTAQEAAAARRIALDRGWKRVLVVTSKYHLRRTRFAFRR